jgi:hypothetical protein
MRKEGTESVLSVLPLALIDVMRDVVGNPASRSGRSTALTCTAVTLYSGQLVAQSE